MSSNIKRYKQKVLSNLEGVVTQIIEDFTDTEKKGFFKNYLLKFLDKLENNTKEFFYEVFTKFLLHEISKNHPKENSASQQKLFSVLLILNSLMRMINKQKIQNHSFFMVFLKKEINEVVLQIFDQNFQATYPLVQNMTQDLKSEMYPVYIVFLIGDYLKLFKEKHLTKTSASSQFEKKLFKVGQLKQKLPKFNAIFDIVDEKRNLFDERVFQNLTIRVAYNSIEDGKQFLDKQLEDFYHELKLNRNITPDTFFRPLKKFMDFFSNLNFREIEEKKHIQVQLSQHLEFLNFLQTNLLFCIEQEKISFHQLKLYVIENIQTIYEYEKDQDELLSISEQDSPQHQIINPSDFANQKRQLVLKVNALKKTFLASPLLNKDNDHQFETLESFDKPIISGSEQKSKQNSNFIQIKNQQLKEGSFMNSSSRVSSRYLTKFDDIGDFDHTNTHTEQNTPKKQLNKGLKFNYKEEQTPMRQSFQQFLQNEQTFVHIQPNTKKLNMRYSMSRPNLYRKSCSMLGGSIDHNRSVSFKFKVRQKALTNLKGNQAIPARKVVQRQRSNVNLKKFMSSEFKTNYMRESIQTAQPRVSQQIESTSKIRNGQQMRNSLIKQPSGRTFQKLKRSNSKVKIAFQKKQPKFVPKKRNKNEQNALNVFNTQSEQNSKFTHSRRSKQSIQQNQLNAQKIQREISHKKEEMDVQSQNEAKPILLLNNNDLKEDQKSEQQEFQRDLTPFDEENSVNTTLNEEGQQNQFPLLNNTNSFQMEDFSADDSNDNDSNVNNLRLSKIIKSVQPDNSEHSFSLRRQLSQRKQSKCQINDPPMSNLSSQISAKSKGRRKNNKSTFDKQILKTIKQIFKGGNLENKVLDLADSILVIRKRETSQLIKGYEKELQNRTMQKAQLQEKKRKQDKELKEIKKKNQSLLEENDNVRQQNQSLQRRIEDQKGELEKQIREDFQKSFIKKDEKYKVLKQQFLDLQLNLENLSNKYQDCKGRAKEGINIRNQEISKRNKEIQKLKQQVRSFERQNQQKSQQLERLASKIRKFKKCLNGIRINYQFEEVSILLTGIKDLKSLIKKSSNNDILEDKRHLVQKVYKVKETNAIVKLKLKNLSIKCNKIIKHMFTHITQINNKMFQVRQSSRNRKQLQKLEKLQFLYNNQITEIDQLKRKVDVLILEKHQIQQSFINQDRNHFHSSIPRTETNSTLSLQKQNEELSNQVSDMKHSATQINKQNYFLKRVVDKLETENKTTYQLNQHLQDQIKSIKKDVKSQIRKAVNKGKQFSSTQNIRRSLVIPSSSQIIDYTSQRMSVNSQSNKLNFIGSNSQRSVRKLNFFPSKSNINFSDLKDYSIENFTKKLNQREFRVSKTSSYKSINENIKRRIIKPDLKLSPQMSLISYYQKISNKSEIRKMINQRYTLLKDQQLIIECEENISFSSNKQKIYILFKIKVRNISFSPVEISHLQIKSSSSSVKQRRQNVEQQQFIIPNNSHGVEFNYEFLLKQSYLKSQKIIFLSFCRNDEKQPVECVLPISLNKLLRFRKEKKDTFTILDSMTFAGEIQLDKSLEKVQVLYLFPQYTLLKRQVYGSQTNGNFGQLFILIDFSESVRKIQFFCLKDCSTIQSIIETFRLIISGL